MNSEYLLFNIFILCAPLALSFDRKVRFVNLWGKVVGAIAPVSVIFLSWDIIVNGRHWSFNEKYTLAVRFWDLPIEEWLFFITVPFAVLFIWEVLQNYWPEQFKPSEIKLYWLIPLFFLLAGMAYAKQKEYTAFTLLALAVLILLDRLLKTAVLQRPGTLWFGFLITLLMLIFNGYLTARPVVLYQESYQLGIRIFTIPLEDFGYGYALLFLNVVVYEKLRGKRV